MIPFISDFILFRLNLVSQPGDAIDARQTRDKRATNASQCYHLAFHRPTADRNT